MTLPRLEKGAALNVRPTRDEQPSLLRRCLRIAIIVVAAGFLGVLLWLNIRLYAAPRGASVRGEIAKDARLQLANIGRRLRAGEGRNMQRIFPEGWFFSHALYGMAWVNVGLQTGDEILKRPVGGAGGCTESPFSWQHSSFSWCARPVLRRGEKNAPRTDSQIN